MLRTETRASDEMTNQEAAINRVAFVPIKTAMDP